MGKVLHVEVARNPASHLKTADILKLLEETVGVLDNPVTDFCLSNPKYEHLKDHIISISFCSAGSTHKTLKSDTPGPTLKQVKRNISKPFEKIEYHVFKLNEEAECAEFVDEEDEDGQSHASYHWMLPSQTLHDLWDSVILKNEIKAQLIDYVKTTVLYGDKKVNESLIAWNKVILLHGPPGTGKTTLCKALAHKATVRLGSRFDYGQLVEINSHSLFSKWVSESGKLILKIFDKIQELIDDPHSIVFLLIDEIESLTKNRQSLGSPDCIRAVNALLAQIDRIRKYPNVVILATSNMVGSIDIAFIDRADMKVYIGNPQAELIYEILASSVNELIRVGIVTAEEDVLIPQTHLEISKSDTSYTYARQLVNVAKAAIDLSGRALRKIPFLTHVRYVKSDRCPLREFLDWMLVIVRREKQALNAVAGERLDRKQDTLEVKPEHSSPEKERMNEMDSPDSLNVDVSDKPTIQATSSPVTITPRLGRPKKIVNTILNTKLTKDAHTINSSDDQVLPQNTTLSLNKDDSVILDNHSDIEEIGRVESTPMKNKISKRNRSSDADSEAFEPLKRRARQDSNGKSISSNTSDGTKKVIPYKMRQRSSTANASSTQTEKGIRLRNTKIVEAVVSDVSDEDSMKVGSTSLSISKCTWKSKKEVFRLRDCYIDLSKSICSPGVLKHVSQRKSSPIKSSHAEDAVTTWRLATTIVTSEKVITQEVPEFHGTKNIKESSELDITNKKASEVTTINNGVLVNDTNKKSPEPDINKETSESDSGGTCNNVRIDGSITLLSSANLCKSIQPPLVTKESTVDTEKTNSYKGTPAGDKKLLVEPQLSAANRQNTTVPLPSSLPLPKPIHMKVEMDGSAPKTNAGKEQNMKMFPSAGNVSLDYEKGREISAEFETAVQRSGKFGTHKVITPFDKDLSPLSATCPNIKPGCKTTTPALKSIFPLKIASPGAFDSTSNHFDDSGKRTEGAASPAQPISKGNYKNTSKTNVNPKTNRAPIVPVSVAKPVANSAIANSVSIAVQSRASKPGPLSSKISQAKTQGFVKIDNMNTFGSSNKSTAPNKPTQIHQAYITSKGIGITRVKVAGSPAEAQNVNNSNLQPISNNKPRGKKTRTWVCEQCDEAFHFKRELNLHHSTAHNKITLAGQCSGCKKSFARPDYLKRHELKCKKKVKELQNKPKVFISFGPMQSESYYECDSPGWKMSPDSKKSVQKSYPPSPLHLLEAKLAGEENGPTKKTKFGCSSCPQVYVSEKELKAHEIFHQDERPYDCSTCSKTFKREASLNFHVKMAHQNSPEDCYSCTVCGMMFDSETEVASHENNTHFIQDTPSFDVPETPSSQATTESSSVSSVNTDCDQSGSYCGTPQFENGNDSLTSNNYNNKSDSNFGLDNLSGAGEFPLSYQHCDICGECFLHDFELTQHQQSFHQPPTPVEATTNHHEVNLFLEDNNLPVPDAETVIEVETTDEFLNFLSAF